MIERLRRLLPSREAVRANPWLRWIGPSLNHPRLWHLSRRGIALGMALGVFFGLLVPIAQIPLAAGVAVVLRANLPTAVASTLVTNPLTFGPVYYAAWRVGCAILGAPAGDHERLPPIATPATGEADGSRLLQAWNRVTGVGKPLLLGLSIFACAASVLSYLLVSWAWHLKVWIQRRRRRRQRASQ